MKLNNEKIMNDIDEKMDLLGKAIALLLDAEDFDIDDLDVDMSPDGECEININGTACDEHDDDDCDICDGDCDNCEYVEDEDEDDCAPCLGLPAIDRILFNPPATIVFWADGTKTVVRCMEDQPFERYAGFSAAVMKKLFGSTSRAKRVMECCASDQETPEPEPKKQTATTKRPDVSEDSDLAEFKKDVTDELATKVAGLILAILGFHKPTEEKE